MLLAADIGNTNIGIALFKGKRLVRAGSMPADSGDYRKALLRICRSHSKQVKKAVLVSVAPKAAARFVKDAKKAFGPVKIYKVGRDIKVPMRSRYNKKQIGQDRLVTAFAAAGIYGAPCLVVDFGTAVTFDAVSGKGEYLGGLILPGIKMSLDSLYRKTALLPKVALKRTRTFIATDTRSSIINGMIYGYGSICEGMARRFREKLGRDLKIVATGGDAELISKYSRSIRHVRPLLSLEGLGIIADLVK